MTTKPLDFTADLTAYLVNMNPPEPELLARLAAETDVMPRASMRVGWVQARFLMALVALVRARRTIEVGVFTGYSALCTALALPEDGRIVACDRSEEWTAVARRYWREAGVEHKIDLRLGVALDALDGLLARGEAESFDFAFIDADKVNYRNYFERCLRLVRPGGLIAVDNTLWYGRVVDPAFTDPDTEAVRAFNAWLRDDPRTFVVMTAVGDGVTLAVKTG